MFKKILIANRGEIALRIVRACRELGISTVAVYSEADRESLHVRFADQAVCIGPSGSGKSYLNVPAIISAAEITDADAIHPGYGFLAENADFADICAQCQITFIGPTPEVINKMGDKAEAKRTMRNAGVPVVPGSEGVVSNIDEALAVVSGMEYPVIIKAVAGGGGRGMRIANNDTELRSSFLTARSEAENAFGNPDVYIEKYIFSPKHVEFQILGDSHGNAIHLGERDCSVQRRHQKLIEETPCAIMTPQLRKQMGDAAVSAAKAVGYCGAGTIEFLLDKSSGKFYFMEMNTRVQVEHPVTEEVTHIDIIKEQIRVADGAKLSKTQEQIEIVGHSIECRVNAEDPDRDFMPSPGKIVHYHQPGGPGVRVDSHAYEEYLIPPYYDSMIAKLVVWAPSRDEAIARMIRALDEYIIEGIKTTLPFHIKILNSDEFREGKFGTDFLERYMKELKRLAALEAAKSEQSNGSSAS